MERNSPKSPFLTIPQIRREYGIGLETLRREAARGSFPVYEAGTPRRHRVRRDEFEAWLSSTRLPVVTEAKRRRNTSEPVS